MTEKTKNIIFKTVLIISLFLVIIYVFKIPHFIYMIGNSICEDIVAKKYSSLETRMKYFSDNEENLNKIVNIIENNNEIERIFKEPFTNYIYSYNLCYSEQEIIKISGYELCVISKDYNKNYSTLEINKYLDKLKIDEFVVKEENNSIYYYFTIIGNLNYTYRYIYCHKGLCNDYKEITYNDKKGMYDYKIINNKWSVEYSTISAI